MWLDHLSKTLVPAFQRLLPAKDEEKQRAAREELYASLRKFAGAVKGPYFLGEEFSVVDAAVAPWIVRDYVITENRGYVRGEVSPEWEAYGGRVEKRDSVVNTSSVSIQLGRMFAVVLR